MPVLINDCGWDNDEKIEETKNKIKDYFNINSNNNVIIYYEPETIHSSYGLYDGHLGVFADYPGKSSCCT